MRSGNYGRYVLTGILLIILALAGTTVIIFSKEILPQNMFGGAMRTILIAFSAAALAGAAFSFKIAHGKKHKSQTDKKQ
jgi:hypothetical protein